MNKNGNISALVTVFTIVAFKRSTAFDNDDFKLSRVLEWSNTTTAYLRAMR